MNAPPEVPSLHAELQPGKRAGTLIFLHGNSSSSAVFDPIFASGLNDHSLFRFDLPGHGRSAPAEDPADYAYQRLCDRVVAAIDDILDDILLIGNSLGGHLAIDVAPRLRRLRGLVIFGSPPLAQPVNFGTAFNPVPELAHLFTGDVSEADIDAVFRASCHPGCNADALKEQFRVTDKRVRSALAQSIASGDTPDEVATLRDLEVPKYFIHPAQDRSPNMDYVRGLDVGLRIIDLPDSGHYPSFENPDAFRQVISQIATEVFADEA